MSTAYFPSERRPSRRGLVSTAWLALVCIALGAAPARAQLLMPAKPVPPPIYDVHVVKTYPHDREAFTQGLIFHGGHLYESTGLNGRSSLRKVDLESGRVLKQHSVDPAHFAEGLTAWKDGLIQLTWRTQTGFVYGLRDFKQRRTFRYVGEGWGLTHDGKRLIMSDGTSVLRFLDPETFEETGRVDVHVNGRPLNGLNELEYVKGQVLANVWPTDHIVMIDPASGAVTGQMELLGLLTEADRKQPVDVLNGIAYDAKGDRLFITGKWWPKLFEVRLERRP
ncbi:MAG TPA: glutaminyl-peptide cyclotransferase [Dokdonella sp.]|uniref:glutaminyl-peptide cyclotransferase n=1 Tax=Dokdonella sp. TaxID=2291710 RepID=UPI002BC887E4|nr:glutaminyl-peptide cyclotransferase [Dokdonella sp.]HUD40670.1 glutaminyl-peptide cyclotransferase [Dokdonella sp.]